jgi:hypothetical protein
MSTGALNYNLDTFYFNLINRELHKTTYYSNQSFNFSKLIFLNKLNRSHYWFPANTGSNLERKKMLKLNQKSLHSSFSFSSPIFLDLIKLQIKSSHEIDVECFIKTPEFNNALTLLNETFRKQAFKKVLPRVKEGLFNVWNRPTLINRNIYLSYFIDFSPHRSLSKLRKFNFISLNAWWLERTWLFAFPKMRTLFLRWWKSEHFKSRFLRFPGMSFSYWAEQQLKHDYYTTNSFDLTADTYSSNAFIQQHSPVSLVELQNSFKFLNDKLFNLSLLYWFLKNSGLQNNISQLSYSAFSYGTHHYTYGANRLYLKNHYASFTPKYAHAYFARFRRRNFQNVYPHLRWYIHLVDPVYWNLRDGLDYHPHEFWTWESVSWWEDNVFFNFIRFKKKRRQGHFFNAKTKNELGYYNLDAIWLYKTWFHEHIFLELVSSYFKSYLNFQYLSPYSRFSSEYPKKKFGHFDPKWQDRLFEYTFYHHPDYFFPSTNIFYDYYSDSVLEKHLSSFLMLNFSWKFNKDLLFLTAYKKFMPRFIRSSKHFTDSHDIFTPSFKMSFTGSDFIFPLLIDNKSLLSKQLILFESNLVFLLNFFCKSDSSVELNDVSLNYLYNYLSHSGLLLMNKKIFLSYFDGFDGLTYADLVSFLVKNFNLLDVDCAFHRERIVVEYTAFKRWYTLLVSEYINNK